MPLANYCTFYSAMVSSQVNSIWMGMLDSLKYKLTCKRAIVKQGCQFGATFYIKLYTHDKDPKKKTVLHSVVIGTRDSDVQYLSFKRSHWALWFYPRTQTLLKLDKIFLFCFDFSCFVFLAWKTSLQYLQYSQWNKLTDRKCCKIEKIIIILILKYSRERNNLKRSHFPFALVIINFFWHSKCWVSF